MATISEYRRNLQNAIRQLDKERKRNCQLISLDALALVKRRVINRGQTASGGRFRPYSPDYKKVRQAAGRPTTYKNFSFTGDMWKDVQPIVLAENDSSITIGYDARKVEERLKLQSNISREGNILALSDDEEELISDANRERVLKTLRQNNVI